MSTILDFFALKRPVREPESFTEDLDESQRHAVETAAMGANMLLTGMAGTGKSLVIRRILQQRVHTLRAELDGKRRRGEVVARAAFSPDQIGVWVCAMTGVAAANLDCPEFTAHTLDSWLGGTSFRAGFRPAVKARLRDARLLVVDEVSMMSCAMLRRLNMTLKKVRKEPAVPFGGLQVVFVGDMYQLPPVIKDHGPPAKVLAAEPLFRECVPVTVELHTQHRQSADLDYASFLARLRVGESTRTDIEFLCRWSLACTQQMSVPGRVRDPRMVSLRATNAEVNEINRAYIQDLIARDAEHHTYTASFDLAHKAYAERLFHDGVVAPEVTLAVGMPVMHTYNGKVGGKAAAMKVTNGTLGLVIGFTEARYPLVQFEGKPHPVVIMPHAFKYDGDDKTMERMQCVQMGLRGAAACTYHRCQGKTMQKIEIALDRDRLPRPGMLYVALSRAQRRLDICFTGFHLLTREQQLQCLRPVSSAAAFERGAVRPAW